MFLLIRKSLYCLHLWSISHLIPVIVVNISYYVTFVQSRSVKKAYKYRMFTPFFPDMLDKSNKTLFGLRHVTQTTILFMTVLMGLFVPFPKVMRIWIVVVDSCLLRAWDWISLFSVLATPLPISNWLCKGYFLRNTPHKSSKIRWYIIQSGRILPPPPSS